ncbi:MULTISPECIES: hypothetical protein [unclassified Streptomyces]|uniref:hypothetical protein n=1 Tax=unclassified Streptomyces TaxID=2593676 RepID=UPI003804B81B
MKSLKIAAAVAGSLAVAGAAAPAFAHGHLTHPMSPNSGVDSLAQHLATAPVADAMPIQTNLLDPQSNDSLRHTVGSAARGLGETRGTAQTGRLLGGIPLGQ